jgi:hypothetical protein
MSLNINHPLSPATAAQSDTPVSHFQEFCQREMQYHKTMGAMYEWLLAQEALGIPAEFDGIFESIFVAGLESLAAQKTT